MLFRTRPSNPALNATKKPTAIDIAWAAGVYEGEGSIRLCGRGKRSLAGSIPQKDPEILYRLRDLFGGSVNPPSGANPCFHWDVCGDRARLFVAQIYYLLSDRRKSQAKSANALDFLKGESPVGLSLDELKSRMLCFYEEHFRTTWVSPDFKRTEEYRRYNREQMRKYRAQKKTNVIAIA